MKLNFQNDGHLSEGFPKKSCCSFGFCPNEGGRALPKFFVTFSEMHFWSIKGVYFLQNANNLSFKLFFMLYTWPTKQVFCLYLRRILDNKSFWMSLKLTFLALKKSGTSCPKWGVGERGVEVIWTISKKTSTFFRENIPKIKKYKLIYLQKW